MQTQLTDLSPIIIKGRIRAKANSVLTPEISTSIGVVHGSIIGKRGNVIAAREYNNDCRMLKRAYIAGAMSSGVNVLNLHSTPVPLIQFSIRRLGASAGVYFSAGHSAKGVVSIRFFDSSGIELSEGSLLNTLNENFKSGNIQRVDSLEIGTISGIEHTEEIYKKAIPQFINQNLIRNRRLRVVMDCSYGPVGKISPEILSNLNTDVIALNTTSQNFTAETFPNLDSMRRVVSIIRAAEADLGVIYDADGSRALIFDDTGNLVSSEELGMLFLTYEPALKKTHNSGGAIVASSTVSMVMEQFLESIGIRISRVSNMPGAISRRLREDRGIFGISDTLKFYFPQYGPYSDATYTLMKIIEIIAEQQVSLSSLVRSFPRPIRASKTISGVLTTQKKYGLENLAATSGFVVQDTMDGLKIAKAGAEHTWVLVIPSLHSSVTELISEADERANADEMIRAVELLVKKIVE